MFAGIHLIVRARLERRVRQRVFRTDGVAEIVCRDVFCPDIVRGGLYDRTYVKKRAYGVGYVEIEIVQILPTAFEERKDVVGVIVEKRTLAVGRHYSVPVNVPPRAVVAYPDVAHKAFAALITLYGHRKGLRSSRRGYHATVAVGLLHVVVVAFNQTPVIAVQLLKPLHRTEVS